MKMKKNEAEAYESMALTSGFIKDRALFQV